MGCLIDLIKFPLYIIYCTIKFMFYVLYLMLIIPITFLSSFLNPNSNIDKKVPTFNYKNNKQTKSKAKTIYNLSKEDQRIAKEERMSAADYIEAEEYDDDNLDKDEWQR